MPLDQDLPAPAEVSEEFAPPPVDVEAVKLVRAALVVIKHRALERVAAIWASRERREIKLLVADEEALEESRKEVELASSSAPVIIDERVSTFKMTDLTDMTSSRTLRRKTADYYAERRSSHLLVP